MREVLPFAVALRENALVPDGELPTSGSGVFEAANVAPVGDYDIAMHFGPHRVERAQRIGRLGHRGHPIRPAIDAERCATCGPPITVCESEGWCRCCIHKGHVTSDDSRLDLALEGKDFGGNLVRSFQGCG